jgi:ribosomal protein L16 Arg81 hydroxylase
VEFFNGDLASLLHPISVDEFFRDYWGEKPLHIHRENCDYFKGLYSSMDIDDCLRFAAPAEEWNEKVKMAIKFKMVSSEVLFDQNQPGFDYQMIRKSQRAVSLIMNFIQDHNCRVFQMARILEQNLRGRIKGRVNVNAYLSPGKSYINPHLDSHDELNIQVEGTKCWRVYEPRIPNPYFGMPMDNGFDPEFKTHYLNGRTPCMEVTLQPGDFMYMPRGYWHDPVNADKEPSLGLTIGVHPICWLDTAIASARAAAEKHQDLRHSLPGGLSPDSRSEQMMQKNIHGIFNTMSETVSLSELIAILERDTPSAGLGPADLYLPSLEALDDLGPDSLLSRPGGNDIWKFYQSYGLLRFTVGEREIGLRKELKESLEHIRDNAFFTPADLPGELTPQEKTSFCRFLLNFGALEFVTS